MPSKWHIITKTIQLQQHLSPQIYEGRPCDQMKKINMIFFIWSQCLPSSFAAGGFWWYPSKHKTKTLGRRCINAIKFWWTFLVLFFYKKSWISHLLPVFFAKNVPQVISYQKQVGDFGAIFVRKHPLAPGLVSSAPSETPVSVRADLENQSCYI